MKAPTGAKLLPEASGGFPACPGAARWMYPIFLQQHRALAGCADKRRLFSGRMSNVGISSISLHERAGSDQFPTD